MFATAILASWSGSRTGRALHLISPPIRIRGEDGFDLFAHATEVGQDFFLTAGGTGRVVEGPVVAVELAGSALPKTVMTVPTSRSRKSFMCLLVCAEMSIPIQQQPLLVHLPFAGAS